MTYDEMISYIEGVSRFGICLGLGRIKELLKRLSNPEKNLPRRFISRETKRQRLLFVRLFHKF